MAIGIAAFSFISVLGLIPTGMKTFRQAVDSTVGSQIVQRVINEAQQTDFDQLTNDPNSANPVPGSTGFAKPARYFDDQGEEIIPASKATPPVLSAIEKQKIIYWVNVRITADTVTPYTGGTQPAQAKNASLATVTVQIANNPAQKTLTPDTTTNLWSDNLAAISMYSGLVARNK